MQNPEYRTASAFEQHYSLKEQQLADRVVMISGATGGLGTALSKTCAAAGATVVLASRKIRKLEKLYDVIARMGTAEPAMIPLEQDKAGPAEYGEIADMLEKEFGKVDCLVHTSADLGTPTPQMAIEHAEWIRVMNVNLTSARLLSLYCLPLLTKSDLSSMVYLLDHKPSAYWGGYGVAKQALQGFMHMLADENEGRRDAHGNPALAINGYDPGPMRTPLRRRAFPGELESESRPPEERLGPLLALMLRENPALTGQAISYGDRRNG